MVWVCVNLQSSAGRAETLRDTSVVLLFTSSDFPNSVLFVLFAFDVVHLIRSFLKTQKKRLNHSSTLRKLVKLKHKWLFSSMCLFYLHMKCVSLSSDESFSSVAFKKQKFDSIWQRQRTCFHWRSQHDEMLCLAQFNKDNVCSSDKISQHP